MKKIILIQFILGIISMILSFYIVLAFSMEEPHYVFENYTVLFVPLVNAIWFIPYYIYFYKRKLTKNLIFTILIYSVFIIPVISYKLYTKKFNSYEWKSETDNNYVWIRNGQRYPSHKNGNMIDDIIESKITIGKDVKEIEKILGKNYFIDSTYYVINNSFNNEVNINYPYSDINFLDFCDYLTLHIKNGKCVSAKFGGCD